MWSEDECHFQRHGTRCRTWIPPEEAAPVVLHAPTRESISCFGADNLHTGMFVHAFSPVFNAATFEACLQRLLLCGSNRKRMVVVLDNARDVVFNRLNSLSSTVDELRHSCTPGKSDGVLLVAERALIKHIEKQYPDG